MWGSDVELVLGSEPEARVGDLSRRAIGRRREVSRVRLYGLEYYFLRWEKDCTHVIECMDERGTVRGVWQRRLALESGGGLSVLIRYPFWPWRRARWELSCEGGRCVGLFPGWWPERGEWLPAEVEALKGLPEKLRDLLLVTLIWKNTLDCTSVWQL